MQTEEILNQITELFKNTLDDQKIVLRMDTTTRDIEEWDSLNHPVLIGEIEKHFRVSFKLKEVIGFKNVGDIVKAIEAKVGDHGK